MQWFIMTSRARETGWEVREKRKVFYYIIYVDSTLEIEYLSNDLYSARSVTNGIGSLADKTGLHCYSVLC